MFNTLPRRLWRDRRHFISVALLLFCAGLIHETQYPGIAIRLSIATSWMSIGLAAMGLISLLVSPLRQLVPIGAMTFFLLILGDTLGALFGLSMDPKILLQLGMVGVFLVVTATPLLDKVLRLKNIRFESASDSSASPEDLWRETGANGFFKDAVMMPNVVVEDERRSADGRQIELDIRWKRKRYQETITILESRPPRFLHSRSKLQSSDLPFMNTEAETMIKIETIAQGNLMTQSFTYSVLPLRNAAFVWLDDSFGRQLDQRLRKIEARVKAARLA